MCSQGRLKRHLLCPKAMGGLPSRVEERVLCEEKTCMQGKESRVCSEVREQGQIQDMLSREKSTHLDNWMRSMKTRQKNPDDSACFLAWAVDFAQRTPLTQMKRWYGRSKFIEKNEFVFRNGVWSARNVQLAPENTSLEFRREWAWKQN